MGDTEDTHIRHAFDSFCKKVVRNEALNIQKRYARFRKRQIPIEVLEQEGVITNFYYSEPRININSTFIVLGVKISISNEELSSAIKKLSSLRQGIILMSFFIGLNDREIGEIIGKSLGSIWYQRQSALVDLEKYFGVKYEEK